MAADREQLPDRTWREGESLGEFMDRVARSETVVERDRLRVEVETLRAEVETLRETLDGIAQFDGADWDVEGFCGAAADAVARASDEVAGSDPTDPSTDLENVNAAYVIERDEAQRLRVAIERLRVALVNLARLEHVNAADSIVNVAGREAREALESLLPADEVTP